MKSISELDHYELLEIPRAAPASEIERAYRQAQQTYAENSLALYSVFENGDAESIRLHVDEAYHVLANSELREEYDRQLGISPSESRTASPSDLENEESSSFEASSYDASFDSSFGRRDSRDENSATASFFSSGDEQVSGNSIEEIVDEFDALEEDGSGEFDGVRLRRTRLFRGYEIDDISDVTKVSGTHLRNIEAENFEDLPADVYVRGFVTAYAKTIGLDPNVVVPGYMARVAQSREGEQRGRFLGRS